ncbi:MAG: glycoside hydrolase family 130 protein [Gammaproteobacteria bacterium]|nr:glycoside hydrolase family 130 protein [Gammaproteobacteria bacterium]
MNAVPRVRRRKWKLTPDPTQVICRLLLPDGSPLRIRNLVERVLALSEAETTELLAQVMQDFSERHRHLQHIIEHHFKLIEGYLPPEIQPNETQRLLIGAYCTMEYSIASAALFNPSIVVHPDQSGLKAGTLRFIMSLRAVGEGHISSIVFRSGTIGVGGNVLFDPVSDYVETPGRQLDATYDKHLFQLKLLEMRTANDITAHLLDQLPEQFSFSELQIQIEQLFRQPVFDLVRQNETFVAINWLANSNYRLHFHHEHDINERVIFPTSENDRGGVEDARFVQFYDDDGSVMYYATYTAYNGSRILPQLIETSDFLNFNIVTLNGRAVQNKGMALFPRKINGKYVMLSRQDGVNNHIMYSDHLHFWQYSCVIQEPTEPWEFIQVGNCGSPLETSQGWLVLTHGVGPMREYSIGAMLLDLDDPSKIIKRLKQPLLSPHEHEREGYVPNVVYSCGALIHENELIIPYAMSDISSGMASVNVQELIDCMTPVT